MVKEARDAPPVPAPPDQAEQERLIAAFAQLHDDLEAGRLSFDQFESRRDRLRSQLVPTE
jgi:hypothetical protein